MPSVNPSCYEEIAKQYLAGQNAYELGRMYNTTPKTIGKILERQGIDRRKKRLDHAFDQEIAQQYLNGISSDKLADKYNCSKTTIFARLKEMNIESRSNKINSKRYDYDENYFKYIDTQEKAYWLGFIYADGYITQRDNNFQFGLSLGAKDSNHLEKLKVCLKSNHNIHTYKSSGGYCNETKYSRLLISSNVFCSHLQNHGVFERKTLILQPPTLTADLISHFIRGYLDGDGSITRTAGKYGDVYAMKICGTPAILNYIKDWLENKLQLKVGSFSRRKPEHLVETYEVCGNLKVLSCLDLLYENATIYLDRKHERYQELCQRYRRAQ